MSKLISLAFSWAKRWFNPPKNSRIITKYFMVWFQKVLWQAVQKTRLKVQELRT